MTRQGIFALQEHVMGIEVNVTRQFTVNGKQYHSLEEVPPELREAVRSRLASATGSALVHGEIVVNGRHYDDVKTLPESIREMYEVAMQCIGPGQGPIVGKPPARPTPVAPQASASRRLMMGSLLLCLIVCLLIWLLPR